MNERSNGAATLANAPDLLVTAADGRSLRLSSLWAERPLVLVFLPPTATEFCADNAAQMRDGQEIYGDAGGSIAGVIAKGGEEASAFAREYRLEFTLVCDEGRGLQSAFGLYGESAHGSFVIDTAGAIRYAHRGAAASDYPATAVLVQQVCAITGAVLKTPPADLLARAPAPTDFVAPVAANGNASASFRCAKCGFGDYDVRAMSTSGGIWSRIFNFQYRRFSAVTCKRCTYTELYRAEGSGLQNALDILAGR